MFTPFANSIIRNIELFSNSSKTIVSNHFFQIVFLWPFGATLTFMFTFHAPYSSIVYIFPTIYTMI